MFLKPATKGHIVHLANNYLKRTIQEHTISWKLHPESSVVCLFITLADEARQYESCIEIGIKQPRLSWTGTGEKEERRERKMKKTQTGANFLELWKRAKSLKYRSAFKDKSLQSSSSSFSNKSLGRRKNTQDVEKQPMLEQKPLLYSTACSLSPSFKSKTLSNLYFQY